jgi:hypothetical protein
MATDAPTTATSTGTARTPGTGSARARLAQAQTSLLATLVAGAHPPEGFDEERLAVQRRALLAKRCGVVAKIAPELPEILGDRRFRELFWSYAGPRPMTGGYRADALRFAGHVLAEGGLDDRRARRRLRVWWLERSGPRPLPEGRLRRMLYLATH